MARTDPRPHMRRREPVICPGCGSVSLKIVSHIKAGQKYCTLQCYWAARAKRTFNESSGTKHCARCGIWKPLSEFQRATSEAGQHGRQAYCRTCGYEKNKEWRAQHPEGRKAIARRNYAKHAERYRAEKRNLTAEQRVKKNNDAKAYRQRNKDKVRWWNKLRLHRQRGAGVMPDRWHFGWLLCHQDARCAYCGTLFAQEGFEIDHKTPLSRGGTNDEDNLQLVCATCNMKKGRKTDAEYRMQLGAIEDKERAMV